MSRSSQIVIVILLVAVLAFGAAIIMRGRGSQPQRDPSQLVVYAPCGMTSPIGAAVEAFREAHPGINLVVKYDNAVILMRLIRGGDRPDVFMSPGALEMTRMIDEGYVAADTMRDFGTLDLVVFAPKTTPDLNTIQDLAKPHIKTIALADPDFNAVGAYGKEALQNLGIWDSVSDKIFLHEYPLAAVTEVTAGKADAGITYLTCPLETAPDKADASNVRVVATIPRDAYSQVRCQIAALEVNKDRPVAQTFIDFMVADEAQQALAANGLLPAKELK